jgi:hypothetical protein
MNETEREAKREEEEKKDEEEKAKQTIPEKARKPKNGSSKAKETEERKCKMQI